MHTARFMIHGSVAALAGMLAFETPATAQTPKPAPEAKAPAPEGKPIVVTGTRADVIATPDRVSFDVANDLQVQTGTLADALRAVPGVEVDLEGRVSLRGDPGVTILIDGRPSAMMRGESRGDVLMSMPAGQIERVEVISNPSAAMSPEGSAGAINLVTKKARKDTRSLTARATAGAHGRGSLNLSGAVSNGPLTATGDVGYRRFTADARATQLRSRLDPATGTFLDSRQDSIVENTNEGGSARISIDYDLDKQNRLGTEISFRKMRGDAERIDSFAAANPAASYVRTSAIDLAQEAFDSRVSWKRTLPGKGHEFLAEVEVETGKIAREVAAVTDFASVPDAYERIRNAGHRAEYTGKLDYKRPMGKEGSLNLGYQANVTTNDFDYSGARGASFETLQPLPGINNSFAYDLTIHALYGTYDFQIGKLETQAGLRLEAAETRIDQITDAVRFERDYFRAYPTLHLSYPLSKADQLRASYSRRIQRPSGQDLNPYIFYVDPQNLRRGNPSLLPEVTDSLEASWQHRKGGDFYSLTGFYRRSRGGVTDLLSDLGGGVFLTTRANLASGTRTGVEAIANGHFTKTLTYNASATFVWTRIDLRLAGAPAERSGTSATVRANLSWQPTPKDFFQLNAVYSGRQLLPQGYREASGVLNLGYRRKINDRLSVLVTGQNVLDSARQTVLFETPLLRDRVTQRSGGRIVLLGINWNLGSTGRKRQEPGFEFQGGGETPQ
jgi:outer membrane receptor protein involved in Fe transport